MGLFDNPKLRPATSFFKVSIYGQQGAGKTYTASELAAGIAEAIRERDGKCGPVCMIESETGSPKVAHLFAKRGIQFLPIATKSYKDLRDGIKEAVELGASALIVDSVTHYSDNLRESFLKANGKTRMAIWDYGALADLWKPFTEDFLNSPIHFISCGRLAWDYETVEVGEGNDKKRESVKSSSKLRALGGFGYEADILIEMEFMQDRESVGKKPRKAGEKKTIRVDTAHMAFVMKDRWSQLEGKVLIDPTFKDFLPVWNLLAAPAAHQGIAVRTTPIEVVKNWDEIRQRKTIAWEEIKGTLNHHFPGSSGAERQMKNVLLCAVFGTFSDTKIQDLHVEKLEEGFKVMAELCPLAIAENAPGLLSDKSGDSMRAWHDAKIAAIRTAPLKEPDDTNPFDAGFTGVDNGAPEGSRTVETKVTVGGDGRLQFDEVPTNGTSATDKKAPSWKELHAELVAFIRPALIDSDKPETLFDQVKAERKIAPAVNLDDVLNRKRPGQEDVRLLEEVKRRMVA